MREYAKETKSAHFLGMNFFGGNFKERPAFTLAEILITLMIIGFVAVVALPSFITNVNSKAFADAKDIFDKKIDEAMSQMRVADKMAGFSTNGEFLNEFSNYMKVSRTCDGNNLTDCFSSTIYTEDGTEINVAEELKTGKDFGKDSNTNVLAGALFANGTSALVAYDPACTALSPYETADATGCLSLLYDVNGFKKPNKDGADIKRFHIDKLGSVAAGPLINGVQYGAPFVPTAMSHAECIERQGELKLGSCCSSANCPSGDYIAGAAAYCGDADKLLKSDELNEYTKELYGLPSVSISQSYTANINAAKVAAAGFPSGTFLIWTSQEVGDYAVCRRFESTQTVGGACHKANISSILFALCKQ